MSEQEHTQENCPLREMAGDGDTRVRCAECALEVLGNLSLSHPMAQGTFHIDGKPEDG